MIDIFLIVFRICRAMQFAEGGTCCSSSEHANMQRADTTKSQSRTQNSQKKNGSLIQTVMMIQEVNTTIMMNKNIYI